MKTCTRCKLEKEDNDFYRGYSKKCKLCNNAINSAYKANNKERMRAYWREYSAKRKGREVFARYRTVIQSPNMTFTSLWQQCKPDRDLFTIEAKKLLTKLNEQDRQRYSPNTDVFA
jgi:high-affinity Fe2+/Pb2+ permease